MPLGLLLFELDGLVLGLVRTGLLRTTFLEPKSLAYASVYTTTLVLDDPFLPRPSCPLDVLPQTEDVI